MLPEAYVLTVDTPNGCRRLSSKSQLDGTPFKWRFVEGYRAGSPELHELYSPRRNALMMKRVMTAGEIACYAGHRKIWQRILDSGNRYALVLEDDFQITNTDGLTAGLAAVARNTHRWDIVKFFDFRPKGAIHEEVWGGLKFVRNKYPASGCVAYAISRSGCEALLGRTRIYRPVDEDIAHPWETSIRVWSMRPNPVIEVAERLGGSLLETDRYRTRRENRNWRRSLHGLWLDLNKKANAMHFYRKSKADFVGGSSVSLKRKSA